jgi:hypothetical protein
MVNEVTPYPEETPSKTRSTQIAEESNPDSEKFPPNPLYLRKIYQARKTNIRKMR